jgi:hypothetical protein
MIRQQAETGGGTDLKQGERLRQHRQDRQQRRAAAGLVGLRRARPHDRTHRVRIPQDMAAKVAQSPGVPNR